MICAFSYPLLIRSHFKGRFRVCDVKLVMMNLSKAHLHRLPPSFLSVLLFYVIEYYFLISVINQNILCVLFALFYVCIVRVYLCHEGTVGYAKYMHFGMLLHHVHAHMRMWRLFPP